jgi:hypothetical protein
VSIFSTTWVQLLAQLALGLTADGSTLAPVAGTFILERALDSRQAIRSGAIHLTETWTLPYTTLVRDETGTFLDGRYRLDVHWYSGVDHVYEAFGATAPDPVAIMIWDGRHVLCRSLPGLRTSDWSVWPVDRTELPLYNARALGIPLLLSPQTDLDAPFRNAEIVSVSRDGQAFIVTVKPDRSRDGCALATNCTAALTIDPARGWSITSYVVQEDAYGSHWTLKGESQVARFGEVWFPIWHRHEQYRDGALDWTREYAIVDAEFNAAASPREFTWRGTGIMPGALIISYVPGQEALTWNGAEAVPWHDGRLPESPDVRRQPGKR